MSWFSKVIIVKALESEMRYIETLEAAQEDQVCIIKGLQEQQQAKRWAVMARHEALKPPIVVLHESDNESPICLGDKKCAV